jgi:hypothetical protein
MLKAISEGETDPAVLAGSTVYKHQARRTAVPALQASVYPPKPPNATFRTSALRLLVSRRPERKSQLVVSQVWRTHGSHRKINRCSDPTSLSTHGAYRRSMKSISHFENFACFAAPCRLVSCPQVTRGFTPLRTTLQHLRTARLRGSLPDSHQLNAVTSAAFLFRPHSIPIAPPRPPQTRAAFF